VTMSARVDHAETGVGPSIASGSHTKASCVHYRKLHEKQQCGGSDDRAFQQTGGMLAGEWSRR